MTEHIYSYKMFKDGFEIDGEPVSREVAKAMLLGYYAKAEDVEEILNQEVG